MGTVRENQMQDIESIMYSKGQIAAADAMANGATESEAKEAFDDAVYNYSSLILRNIINEQGSYQSQSIYIAKVTGDSGDPKVDDIYGGSSGNATYHLTNDETVTIPVAMDRDNSNPTPPLRRAWYKNRDYYGSGEGQVNISSVRQPDGSEVGVSSTSSVYIAMNYNKTDTGVYADDYQLAEGISFVDDQVDPLMDSQDRVIANGNQTISSIYANYDRDEIDGLRLIDPTTLASEASTDRNTTGYFAYSNAQLSALGLSGDAEVSHIVETQLTLNNITTINGTTISESNTYNATIEGTIYGTADSLSLETGQTYNPDNINGTVILTVATAQDASGSEIDLPTQIILNDTFTIVSATDTQTGDPVSVTTSAGKNYQDYNVTELANALEEYRQLRENISSSPAPPQASDDSNQQKAGFWDGLGLDGAGDWLNTLGTGLSIGFAVVALIGLWLLGRITS